jgi:hypothetical protein
MNVARRVKDLLIDPLAEWRVIDGEIGDPASILTRYVAVLAAIPAVCGFTGATVIGASLPNGAVVRASLFDGLFGAIFGYVMTCATVLLLALIIDLAAPSFRGRRDFNSAVKLAAYAFTPVWLCGVFLLLPGLRFLGFLGFYGAYIFWLGLPLLSKVPENKTANFTVLMVSCAFVLTYLTAVAQRAVFGTAGL